MTARAPTVRVCVSALSLWLIFCCVGLAATKKPPPKPININSATSEELQQVPGIGPVTADKILQMRKSYGAFKGVDDLLAVRGIGKKRLEKMRKYLTAEKAPPKKSAAPAARCPTCSEAKVPAAKTLSPKKTDASETPTESSNEPEEPNH